MNMNTSQQAHRNLLQTTCTCSHQQIRHATLIRRPHRPYTFTQLVTLSDGSTYTHRTTSPAPVYKSTKDTRNTPLWNPSSQKLLSMEADEAGRLRRFREKFGRGWDASKVAAALPQQAEEGMREGDGAELPGVKGGTEEDGESTEVQEGVSEAMDEDNLMDLISGYGREAETKGEAAEVRETKTRSGKGKGGER